jgi:rSAM/selenodomain-associated transferase 1
MAKYPTVGDVKTRLGETMGYEEATRLYICFLKDVVEKVRQLETPYFIYYTPDGLEKEFKQLLGEDHTFVPQKGEDLGVRLFNGFKDSSKMGYPAAIALASDVPDLPVSILGEALDKLKTHDSVLGPSSDGGYYLFGLKAQALSWKLFQGINWSTETVYKETLDVIEKEAVSLHSLEPWDDVDQVRDLSRLANSSDPDFQDTHTWKYLKSSGTF